MTERIRRSGAEWAAILAAQEKSGLSARVFCAGKKIGLPSFYFLGRRLLSGVLSNRKRGSGEFIEVTQE